MQRKILIVDDDVRLRGLLGRYLGEQGFAIEQASDAVAMDERLSRETFDLVVLDLMLPGEDGLAICRRLRGMGNMTPILMLTARGDEIDRILGLEMGADDYLPKPFNPRELLARVNAILRRQSPVHRDAAAAPVSRVSFGDFVFDGAGRSLTRDGQSLPLTSGEFSLLHVLVMHPHQPLSRDRLMELSRGRELDAFDRSVDVQISRLRKLIEVDPAKPRFIQTVWGFGYVFIPGSGGQGT